MHQVILAELVEMVEAEAEALTTLEHQVLAATAYFIFTTKETTMATYAMMNGNTVSNIIIADDKAATEAALGCTIVEYTAENPAGIGWTMDEDGTFNPPATIAEATIYDEGLFETPATE
jgi:hypothetical protein